jgi:hypothetical protein
VTIDSVGKSAFPYIVGPSYYGVVDTVNVGPGGGKVIISEPVTEYKGTSGIEDVSFEMNVYPNPVKDMLTIDALDLQISELAVINSLGERLLVGRRPETGFPIVLDLQSYTPGVYILQATTPTGNYNKMIIKQ